MNLLKSIMELSDSEDTSTEEPKVEKEKAEEKPKVEPKAEKEKQKFTVIVTEDGEEVEKKVKAFSVKDIKAYFGDSFVSAKKMEAEEEPVDEPAEEPTESDAEEAPVKEMLRSVVEAAANLGPRIQFDSYKSWKDSLPAKCTFHKDGDLERAQSLTKDFEGVAGTWDAKKKQGWIYKHYLKEAVSKPPVPKKPLARLSEMATRTTPEKFYELGKKKYGAEKVKALKWPEIAALSKEADVQIPVYMRDPRQKVGRGTFSLVPPDHADSKAAPKAEPKKEAPKAEPKKEEPKAEVQKTYERPQLENISYSSWSEFYDRMKKRFGDFELKRVPYGKQTRDRYGTELGQKLMVNAKTDVVMGVWDVTGSDKIPGRGFVAYGDGYLAKEKQEAPKAPPKPVERRKGGQATPDELKAAMLDAAAEMRHHKLGKGADWRFPTPDKKSAEAEVRYWGQWTGDDGSGDYDFQELSSSSAKEIAAILNQVEKRHPKVAMSYSTGEKNWIYIRAE